MVTYFKSILDNILVIRYHFSYGMNSFVIIHSSKQFMFDLANVPYINVVNFNFLRITVASFLNHWPLYNIRFFT